MKNLTSKMTVDIWSDFVCPWCWIAKKRFEQGLDNFEHKDHVTVNYHCYRIANELPPIPIKSAIYKKVGTEYGVESMIKRIKDIGVSEGLIYNFDTMLFGNTHDAHSLVVASRKLGLQEILSEKLFRASITDGRSIFERRELISLAMEVGFTPEQAKDGLDNPIYSSLVEIDEEKARSIGASGVPLFVVNNKNIISGAQSAMSFLTVLRQAWRDCEEKTTIIDGQSCSVDGCK